MSEARRTLPWNSRPVDEALRERAEAFDRLCAPDFAPVRRAALERLGEVGIPTARNEAFTYMNPAPLFRADADSWYGAPLPSPPEETVPAGPICPHAMCVARPDGGNLLEEEILRAERTTDPVELYALCFADRFDWVRIPPRDEAGNPVVARLAARPRPVAEGRLSSSALRLRLDEGSAAVVEILPVENDVDGWSHLSLAVELGPGSRLTLVGAQPPMKRAAVTSSICVEQAEGSLLEFREFRGGSPLARGHVEVHLDGEGARCELRSLSTLRDEAEQHHHVRIFHHAPRCESDQLYRQIVFDAASASVDGSVRVDRGADGTKSNQLIRSLLLGDKASAAGKPQLLIFADDVQCDHGATHGSLDDEELFYLLSRGFAPDRARAALVAGFAQEIVDLFPECGARKIAAQWTRQ